MLADEAIDIELDGERGSLAPFAVLDDLADRARVAYLGEMDHFVAEKYAFRLLCIRYLASRGWHVVGEEWPERAHQRPFTRGILANDRQPTTALDDAQDRFHDALRRVVPGVVWFSFDADARDTDYVELAGAAETYEALQPAMALRERIMHDKVRRALIDHPDDKVVLLAAAQHLLKDDDRVHPKAGTSGPGGGIVHSIGHHVAHELTDAPVLSMWLLHGEGTSANPWLPPPARLEPQAGTFDAELLARHGDGPCLVRVAEDRHRRAVTAMHDTVLQCRLAEQVDAIVFAPSVSPLGVPPAR
jgi:hypothetical protein